MSLSMFYDPFFSAPESLFGNWGFGRVRRPYNGEVEQMARDLMSTELVGDRLFSHFDHMMEDMQRSMESMHRNMHFLRRQMSNSMREAETPREPKAPRLAASGTAAGQPKSQAEGHSFSRSSVYSYTDTGEGVPKVYEAHTTTRTAPGGIRETRKAVHDSEHKVEKETITREIGDRRHEIHRLRSLRSDAKDERHHYVNVEESEAARKQFEDEWIAKVQKLEALPAPRGTSVSSGRRGSLSSGFGQSADVSAFPTTAAGGQRAIEGDSKEQKEKEMETDGK